MQGTPYVGARIGGEGWGGDTWELLGCLLAAALRAAAAANMAFIRTVDAFTCTEAHMYYGFEKKQVVMIYS